MVNRGSVIGRAGSVEGLAQQAIINVVIVRHGLVGSHQTGRAGVIVLRFFRESIVVKIE